MTDRITDIRDIPPLKVAIKMQDVHTARNFVSVSSNQSLINNARYFQ